MIRSKTGSKSRRGGACKRRSFVHTYDDIISVENLLAAWKEFLRGKRNKQDVQEFQADLMHNIFVLNEELRNKTCRHGGYHHFRIADPKPRDIHKASVRDRLLHHAVYRVLYPYFDKKFIYDSYSCRLDKGTHRAIDRFRDFGRIVSKNHTRTCWVLKCDIRKFFANIDHQILFRILERHIPNPDILWLLHQVVDSFNTPTNSSLSVCSRGLPLGNLTSQLLVNIYMNEFDQWMKNEIKSKYYIRYADDFVFLSQDKRELEEMLPHVIKFLRERLSLELHPDKVFIKTFASGVDFLGWVHFPDHRVLRATTKRRMFRRLSEQQGCEGEEATRQSYRGLLKHGNTKKLQDKVV